MHTATFSPEDNKLRLYPESRLSTEEYEQVKAAGFKWAPKQELFVAPMWTPDREDLLLEMCGEIGDEDTSLVDRAEARAERFEELSEKRSEDATRAKDNVTKLLGGQPISRRGSVGNQSLNGDCYATTEHTREVLGEGGQDQPGGMLEMDCSDGRTRIREGTLSWEGVFSAPTRLDSDLRSDSTREAVYLSSLRQSAVLQPAALVSRYTERQYAGFDTEGKASEESDGILTDGGKPSCSETQGDDGAWGKERCSSSNGYPSDGNSEAESNNNVEITCPDVQRSEGNNKFHRSAQDLDPHPVIIGHHSEKHARKDAERIENGMRRAISMWEASQYWESRAKGALRNAKYKERPDVRARRIKGLEADMRKQIRVRDEAAMWLKAWTAEGLTMKRAQAIANVCWLHLPRKEGDASDSGQQTAYGALTERYPNLYAPRTLDEIVTAAREAYPKTIEWAQRWISHYHNRIMYEKAMLEEVGGTVADKTGPEKGGACKCWASPSGGWSYIQKVNKVSVTVLDNWGNGGKNFTRTIPFDKLAGIMTAAQVQEARDSGILVDSSDGTGFGLLSKPPKVRQPEPESPKAADFDAMREQLKAGVQVVVAPQLFPTPPDLAARMVEMADIQPGMRVLEPSAGTGNLLGAMGWRMFGHNPERGAVAAVEINRSLAGRLQAEYPLTTVYCADFLEFRADDFVQFDRILMNPPFQNGDDIKHIKHAMGMLTIGGILVAICANGPRQRAELMPLCDTWEDLPAGTFAEQGTNVNTALIVIHG